MGAKIELLGRVLNATRVFVRGREVRVDGDLIGTVDRSERALEIRLISGKLDSLDVDGSVETEGVAVTTLTSGMDATVHGDVLGHARSGMSLTVGGSVHGGGYAGMSMTVHGDLIGTGSSGMGFKVMGQHKPGLQGGGSGG